MELEIQPVRKAYRVYKSGVKGGFMLAVNSKWFLICVCVGILGKGQLRIGVTDQVPGGEGVS
jgi:hypothetical protein